MYSDLIPNSKFNEQWPQDWSWGCCPGDNPCNLSILCDVTDCHKFYHSACLKTKFNYSTQEIRRIKRESERFECPSCTLQKIASQLNGKK